MANNLLEKKLECESRLMHGTMQGTQPSDPLSPQHAKLFFHSTLAAWLASLTKTTLNTGGQGAYHNSLKFFFKQVGWYDGFLQAGWVIWWLSCESTHVFVRCRFSSYEYKKYGGFYSCYFVLHALTAYNCLRQPHSLSSRNSTVL